MPTSRPLLRQRKTKIVATLGPGTGTVEAIESLVLSGADVFRLNFSHGAHEDHAARYRIIRDLETKYRRPISVLADMQGPKLRVGTFKDGSIDLEVGQNFRFDLDPTPGDETRVNLPHPELFEVMSEGETLLLDDGKVRITITKVGEGWLEGTVEAGTKLSDRKGFNVPGVVLPISALTEKDRRDLAFALELGVDWVALSFVQRPEDVAEGRKLIAGRAGLMVKLEKPSAVDHLDEIINLTDAVMVARGDLGVELPAEQVPPLQKRIVRACRTEGKPVIVATQMLESMVNAPTPTRAEASDVATAVYDGADAVMLSAETAVGEYPDEAVRIMDKVAASVEHDPLYRTILDSLPQALEPTSADAITAAAKQIADTISAAAIVTYTTSGSTALRAARERPNVPILGLTSEAATARRLALVWGVNPVQTDDIFGFSEMVSKASSLAYHYGMAIEGERLVITAGVPFGTPGATNVVRIAWVEA